ncbi:cyclic lactone autoinducer peptide [Acinetobacter sp. CUI P1]|uniref:Cyclic lactone autoinducer peptide n=1 Tax=Paenibacillus pseudetheri TaxID=2897682 RepID=A0ABN8FFW7_9BACL|nr:cyclic lactone autoinducer peptide [Paenibacillus pseudetheri]MBY3623765.1 cyclic lactone autoinducer peptide [Acinetobacter sp. CUI P1]CAH1054046.1 hypothetical protein PAECIP111894_00191 [Paenibacillus pseudetheri]
MKKWNVISSALAFVAVLTVTPASALFIYGGETPKELLK